MKAPKAPAMWLAALLAVGLIATACGSGRVGEEPRAQGRPVQESAETDEQATLDPAALRDDLRKLWEDHIVWTRMFIVSAAADLPDADAAAARLLQNQDDIGDAVAAFYGEEAGQGLAALLRDHILIAADLVGAAKAGAQAKVEKASERWYANADEIAAFLAAANPNWPQEHMAEMMRVHLDVTLEEATARLGGDWEADIAAYDRIHEDILTMADGLADGIVAQFPERF